MNKGMNKDSSLWERFRRLFSGRQGEAPGPEEQERPTSEEAERGREARPEGEDIFSAGDLRDRVVVMLLFDQLVRIEQVAAAWRHWKDDEVNTPDALWRVVALLPDVDRDAIYARAAHVYAFESVDFNMYRARALLRKHRRTFGRKQWQRMINLNLAPVRIEYDDKKLDRHWVLATHDPARPAVQAFLAELDVPAHELRYASQGALEEVFEAALPRLAAERERPSWDALPAVDEGEEARKESRRFLQSVTKGDSFVEASFYEAAERSGKETEQSTRDPALEGADALPEPSKLFDDMLAGIVRTSGVRAAYLFGNERDQLEIYHRHARKNRHWRTEPHVSAVTMIDFISGRIRSLRSAGKQSEGAVVRWVAGRRLAFRPFLAVARNLPGALPVEGETEVVVIEVLQ